MFQFFPGSRILRASSMRLYNTYIDELTHIISNNQYLLLFYESRTRINVKIIDTILVTLNVHLFHTKIL